VCEKLEGRGEEVMERKDREYFRHIDFEHEFTYGSDPEIFAVDGYGKMIPAFSFLKSQKEAKRESSYVFWDGFQAEMNTDGTAFCLNLLMDDIQEQLGKLTTKLPEGAKLSINNTFRLDDETLKNTEGRFIEFGCKPSFNAYEMKVKKISARKLPYRWAGGHLTFGSWEQPPQYLSMVKAIDKICGVFSVGLAANLDTPNRRQHYGLAGEFRTPKWEKESLWSSRITYGLEYRTLSNFWLCSPVVANLVWELARIAIRIHDTRYMKLLAMPEELVVDTINTCNVEQARKLVKVNEGFYKWALHAIFSKKYAPDERNKITNAALTACYEGLESLGVDPSNLDANWKIGTEEDCDDSTTWVNDAGHSNQTFGGWANAR
jgi:hypothetical protein